MSVPNPISQKYDAGLKIVAVSSVLFAFYSNPLSILNEFGRNLGID
jgi:hypothetical protein